MKNDKPIRLWADFNENAEIGIRLNCHGTIEELKMMNIGLIDGMKLLLWDEDMEDELYVEATARFNRDEQIWYGEFDWNKVKRRPAKK